MWLDKVPFSIEGFGWKIDIELQFWCKGYIQNSITHTQNSKNVLFFFSDRNVLNEEIYWNIKVDECLKQDLSKY